MFVVIQTLLISPALTSCKIVKADTYHCEKHDKRHCANGFFATAKIPFVQGHAPCHGHGGNYRA